MKHDIAFALNFTHLYELDITPTEAKPTFARIAAGITSITAEGNENVAQDNYYDGDGLASSEVTGGQQIVSVEGHRYFGDPVQDYVASLRLVYGNARHSRLRITDPAGEVVEANVTIANISGIGANGESGEKGDFKFELHLNGLPVVTPATGKTLPEAVNVNAVTIARAKDTQKVTPTVTPEGANARCVYAIEDESVATVDAEGNVTGVKQGKTRLNVKCAAKPSVYKVVDVTVSA